MPRKHSNAAFRDSKKIHGKQPKPPPSRTIRVRVHTDDQGREPQPDGYGVVLHGGYSHRWMKGAG